MNKITSEEIAISEILKELLKMKEEKVCLMLKKSKDLKLSSKEKLSKQDQTMKTIPLCKENLN
jgi:hypothetical protein